MNINFFSSLLLMLLVFSVFIGTFQQSVYAWDAKVKYFVACKNVDESKRPPIPIDVSTIFSTNDEKIYFFIHLEDVEGPIKITIKLFKPDGAFFDEADSGWYKEKYNWITFYPWLKISEIQNLIGEWCAEAYLNGELASTLKFMLSPASRVKIIGKTMSLAEGEPFYIGDVLTIKYTLRNEGVTTAKNIVFKFEDITPSEGLIIIETSPPKDLTPGETGEWIIKIKAETPGEYTAVLRLYESESKIIEGNWQITVTLPELQVIEKKISPSEEEPFYVGDVATLTYIIKNNGGGKVKGVKVYVELPDGLKLVSASPAKDLMPKEEGEWIIKIKAEKPGDYKGKITLSVMDVKIAEGELTVKALSKPTSNFIGILTIATIALIIIAVIAVIFIKKKKASLKALEASTPQIGKRFCVKCGAEIPIDVKYCLKCGATQ